MSEKPKEQWWELVSLFRSDEGKEYEHDGQRVFVCGNIGDVTIVQIGEVYGNEKATVARIQAAKQILDVLGIEPCLVVTDAVKFVKMRQVEDEATLAQLTARKQYMVQ